MPGGKRDTEGNNIFGGKSISAVGFDIGATQADVFQTAGIQPTRMVEYDLCGVLLSFMKPSVIDIHGGIQLDGLGRQITAGRYHSLYASSVPSCLQVTAASADGIPMAVEHEALPIMAVQFHPESILTLEGNAGLRLVGNVVDYACACKMKSETG